MGIATIMLPVGAVLVGFKTFKEGTRSYTIEFIILMIVMVFVSCHRLFYIAVAVIYTSRKKSEKSRKNTSQSEQLV